MPVPSTSGTLKRLAVHILMHILSSKSKTQTYLVHLVSTQIYTDLYIPLCYIYLDLFMVELTLASPYKQRQCG